MESKNSVCGFLGGSVHLGVSAPVMRVPFPRGDDDTSRSRGIGTVPFPKSLCCKGLGRAGRAAVAVSLLVTTTYANHKNFGNY